MRNQTFSNSISIAYPDAVAFTRDDSRVIIRSLTAKPVGGYLTFTNVDTLATVEFAYLSEHTALTFFISNALKQLSAGQQQTQIRVTGSISNGDVSFNIESFYITSIDGKTMPGRTHGSTRTCYYADERDIEKIDVYSPASAATFTINGAMFYGGLGVNTLDLSALNIDGDFTIHVTLSYSGAETPVVFGDLWHRDTAPTLEYDIRYIKIETNCGTANKTIELRYRDADGCNRYLAGQLVNETRSTESASYVQNHDMIANTPHRHVNSTTDTLTIGIEDVGHDAFVYDIVQSDNVYVRAGAEWLPAVVEVDELTENAKGTNEIELSITILN